MNAAWCDDRIKQRLDGVAHALLKANGPGGVAGSLVSSAYGLLKSTILDFIKGLILADLVRRDQILGWELPQVWNQPPSVNVTDVEIRSVIAALLDPSFDLRNEGGIAGSTKLDPMKVRAALLACQAQTGAPFEVSQYSKPDKSGSPLYCLTSRKPGPLRTIPLIGNIGRWIKPLSVDAPGL